MQKDSKSPYDEYTKLVYQDSVLPVIESGQAVMIDDSTDLGKEINLVKTPGHSPGHYCLEINTKKKSGIITGDVLHNPIQVDCPSLSTVFCDDKDLSNEKGSTSYIEINGVGGIDNIQSQIITNIEKLE